VPASFPDWIVTGCFYVAVHAVDTLLSHDKNSATSHETRSRLLFGANRYLAIGKCYMPLYSPSRTVRYFADPQKWIPAERIEKDILIRYPYPIEKSVQGLIGADLSLSKITLASGSSPAVEGQE
jgi:hypothetical protein